MIHAFKEKTPIIGKNVYIAPTALIIGNVIIEDDCSIWPYAVLRGDDNIIHIKKGSNIQDHVMIHASHDAPTIIGEYVTIGHQACIHGAIIHDRVIVGMKATVLDKAEVLSDSMIGAHALVAPKKVVQTNWLVMGVPAEYVKHLSQQQVASIVENAKHYIEIKEIYRQENI